MMNAMNAMNAQSPLQCGAPAQPSTNPVFRPHVDIVETQSEFLLRLDVPGATADGLDLQYERGELSVRARIAGRAQPGRAISAEYDVGDYVRTFALGENVDVERIEATLQLGVLTVRLPKSQAAQPRKIQIRAA